MTDKDIEAEELDLLAIPNLSTCSKKQVHLNLMQHFAQL